MKDRDPERFFTLEECLTIGMSSLFNFLILMFRHLDRARTIFVLNIFIITAISLTAYAWRKYPLPCIRFFRDWYVIPFLIVIYLENGPLVPLINPREMDSLVISIDRFLFLGHDPTVLLETIVHPVLSEILQLSYASFYLLPLSLCMILYLPGKTRNDFHVVASTILMGFYLSYIGYYLTPVLGPRFTLDHLQGVPLTGLWTFDFVRTLLAQAEGRMYDCMPSGHALVSLLTVLLSWLYLKRFFPVALVWSLFLLFSTVYLRYHYVTDLVVGMALGTAVFRYGPGLATAFICGNETAMTPPRVDELGEE
ncbi:MAG: PAP2 superfamily protein [Deltaproteobacteria bacterium ADurb.Bin072]|nr:MAG: PAP2 superfamily protein [Deltaproteobacteria bacterium ADurb.Bin072]